MNRLLELMTVPDSFSEEYKQKYFNRDKTITLNNLIQNILNDEQFRNVGESGSPLVKSTVVLNSPTTIFGKESDSYVFFDELSSDFGKLPIQRSNPSHEANRLPREKKIPYDQLVVFGDSLTDLNLMRLSAVGDFSGLKGNSPKGSFTNGYTWLGHINSSLFHQTIIDAVREHLRTIGTTKVSDEEVVSYIEKNKHRIHQLAKLQNEDECNVFSIDDQVVSRSYAKGGATAYSYWGSPSKSITRYFTRFIVSTLSEQRKKFLADELNEANKNSSKLIVEWIGANDLITVNELPSMLEADNVIKARMEHLEELIKNGHTRFVLCNLPDLSLTPRYINKSATEQLNARLCTEYVNRELERGVAELKKLYPDCNIDVCDINAEYKACIQSLQAGGNAAKAYSKYISKEYEIHITTHKPAYISKNEFFIHFYENNNLQYHVIDACGQTRSENIKLEELIEKFDSALDAEAKKAFILAEIKSLKNGQAMKKDSMLRKCILTITMERGDTLPENDIFTPLKDTKAFKRFQDELASENPPRTIEDLGYLPGNNATFFDDVHPSADMHAFLFEIFKKFIEQKYQMRSPAINVTEKRHDHQPRRSKDDADIPKNITKPVTFKPFSNLQPGKTWHESELVAIFLQHYLHQYNQERNSFFGWFRERKLQCDNKQNITLTEIFKHALCPTKGSGARTKEVLKQLGWIDESSVITKLLSSSVDPILLNDIQKINKNVNVNVNEEMFESQRLLY